jgi:hypothetical protein
VKVLRYRLESSVTIEEDAVRGDSDEVRGRIPAGRKYGKRLDSIRNELLCEYGKAYRNSRSSAMALSLLPVAHQCFRLAVKVAGTSLAAGIVGRTTEGSTTVILEPTRARTGRIKRRGCRIVAEERKSRVYENVKRR